MKFKIKRGEVSTLRHGAALIQGRDIPALHPPDMARTRPVSTSQILRIYWALSTLAQPRRVTARRPLF